MVVKRYTPKHQKWSPKFISTRGEKLAYYILVKQTCSQKLLLGGSFVQNVDLFNKIVDLYCGFFNKTVVCKQNSGPFSKWRTFYFLKGGFFCTYQTPLDITKGSMYSIKTVSMSGHFELCVSSNRTIIQCFLRKMHMYDGIWEKGSYTCIRFLNFEEA